MAVVKQVFQNLLNGQTLLQDVPLPAAREGYLLIETRHTLISSGTERMLVDFGQGSFLSKARQQPEKVAQLLQKMKTDGLLPALEAVKTRLAEPIPMGYSNVGVVLAVGPDGSTPGFQVGDRVLSNGSHASVVSVPRNLCAHIPEAVTDEDAVFGVVASIALQGLRLAEPTLGETFTVIGLGLIGLMAVQLLQANGCRVLGVDLDEKRLEMARQMGAETFTGEGNPVGNAMALTGGRGVDGVLLCAATDSEAPLKQAAQMCRQRGRIVLVGTTGLSLKRSDFYEKELSFQVSCSYGPGRYDKVYEAKGQDYPYGLIRWTEQRNFESVLSLMKDGKLNPEVLRTHQFSLDDAAEAYGLLARRESPALGILLTNQNTPEKVSIDNWSKKLMGESSAEGGPPVKGGTGLIGSGLFVQRILLPVLQKKGIAIQTLASTGGDKAVHLAKQYKIPEVSTDTVGVIADSNIQTVLIASRHDSHGDLIRAALQAGKHVFVEKPLCLKKEEVMSIVRAYYTKGYLEDRPGSLLMVGFNRRFAPLVQKMKSLLDGEASSKHMVMTVNAGALPKDHWLRDPEVGGGRLLGEGCHFIDLLRHLAGSSIQAVHTTYLGDASAEDSFTLQIQFLDGSLGVIHYLANGSPEFPKEKLEVFCGGKILTLNNFRILEGYGWSGFRKKRLWRQQKGHAEEMEAFFKAIDEGTEPPIDFNEIIEVTLAAFAALESGIQGAPLQLNSFLQEN